MRTEKVSVCMATFNGINYIRDQINSILPQLIPGDELLISDDGSNDGTWDYILDLSKKNKQVKVIKGPRLGPSMNFFSLFEIAKNDFIFISDQDDFWMDHKIEKTMDAFTQHEDKDVILHMDVVINLINGSKKKCNPVYHGLFRNLMRNSYSGHRMAFRRSFKSYFLKNHMLCPSYDQYIGLLAEKKNKGLFIRDVLDYHYIHGSNVSRPLGIVDKVMIRIKLLRCVLLSN